MTTDITPELRSWLHETISTVPDPAHIYPAVAADAHRSAQQRGWLPPLRPPRFRSALSATKFVVAGIVVALFGGFLLTGVLTQPPDDGRPAAGGTASASAVPADRFSLPAEVPEGVESGTVDTPAGRASWIHLTADSSMLPMRGQVLPWPSGIAVFQAQACCGEVVGSAELWLSSDGIDWQLEPLPLLESSWRSSLTLEDGVYWLTAQSCRDTGEDCSPDDRIWRSTDASTWDEVDMSGLGPFEPAALYWGEGEMPAIAPPVTAGELTLSVVTNGVQFPGRKLGMPVRCKESPRLLGDGRYRMTRDEKPCGPILRFEESDTGLRVIRDKSGKELGEIPGADLSHLDRMSRKDEPFGLQRLIRISDGAVIPVEVPWSQYDYATLFGIDDQMFAYVRDIEGDRAADVTVWRTSDGRSWADLGSPTFLDGTKPTGITSFSSISGSLVVFNQHLPVRTWETTDGVTWSPLPGALPDETRNPHRLGSGWFASDDGPGNTIGDVWSMLVGDTWVSLGALGMERPQDKCRVSPTGVGDTTIFTVSSDCHAQIDTGPAEMWILSLDRSSD